MPVSPILTADSAARQNPSAFENRGRGLVFPLTLLAIGFLLRFANAAYRFLNADEALHYQLSVQPSLAATYRATLTTAHPPLLIVFLHYWGMLGHSELFLRLPFVIAGTLFCWIVFLWLRRVADEQTALTALVLLLFSPALIVLSAEVRQYPLLLLFCACSLYFLDRAIEEDSLAIMALSSVALYGALLTHYSAIIVGLTLGIYGLVRFSGSRSRKGVIVLWAAAQAGAVGLIGFFFVHHISKIKASGLTDVLATTYLRRSILQPGQNPLWFISRSNLRLFHYLFSQGAVGALALALFIFGVVLLIRDRRPGRSEKLPSKRQLAFLLMLPLGINCALAMLRLYPYGGTRHDSYLAIFALSGVAIPVARWKPPWKLAKPIILGLVLAACNLFPTPQGEYIRIRDQNRHLIQAAVASLRSLPPGSIIFTDDQGALLLSYYLCGNRVAQIEQPTFQLFMRAPCGDHSVISLDPDLWIFKADTFPEALRSAQQMYPLAPGTPLWFFQAGWFIDKESALREELKQYGCSTPQQFGRNMFLCRITVGG